MRRGNWLAIAVVLLMLSTPLIPLSFAQQPYYSSATAEPLPISDSHLLASPGTGYANYTLYVPGTAFDHAFVMNALGSLGISPVISGSLWTFEASSSGTASINSTLASIPASLGVRYFMDTGHVLVQPSIQSMAVGQYSNIPFAYTPSLISSAYNFSWALSHGINGSGQTIVVVDAYGEPNIVYDLKAFDAVTGLPPANLSVVYPMGTPAQYNQSWAMETSTDVEWAHAMAPHANIILAVAPSAFTSSLQGVVSYAIDRNLGNIISLSWGSPEGQLGSSVLATYSAVYHQAYLKGITVLAASGDNGANDGTSSLAVNFPASDPYVTAVGGTSLYVLGNTFHQTGWGGIIDKVTYGSGGGYSNYYNTPYWQSATGYNSTMRGVPDVSMDADKYTGMYVVSGGGQYMVGGTSVATPIWADIAALISQYTNEKLHSLNPLLYQIARTGLYNSSFSQITSGTNGYYDAGPGWNPVTGLGTPKVSSLLNASRSILDGYGALADFNSTSLYNSTTISADLSTGVDTSNLAGNGSTYYYIGFYSSRQDSVRWGVVSGVSGNSLMLQVSQGGREITRNYSMPSGYGSNLSYFPLQISYSASSLQFSAGGSTGSLPVFLDFSGEMSPAAGVGQLASESNMTVVGNATFSSIRALEGGTWRTMENPYFSHYSSLNASGYSTIDASLNGDNITFYHSSAAESGRMNSTGPESPGILYSLGYGGSISAQFHLSPGNFQPSWEVNGTAISGNAFSFPSAGGTFNITSSYSPSGGAVLTTVSRVIHIPGMVRRNVTANYSIPGSTEFPGTVVTAMGFYDFTYTGTMRVPVVNGTDTLSASAPGFVGSSYTGQGTGNVSLRLDPVPVNLSVFVFQAGASVTIGGRAATQDGGYHYLEVTPGRDITVNATAAGFGNATGTYYMAPGKNLNLQMSLAPENLSDFIVSGKVTDSLYSFDVSNALVSLSNYSGSYSNQSGSYMIFTPSGKYTVAAGQEMYNNFSTPLNVSGNTVLNIQLIPARISITSTDLVSITHYFPFLFYFGFLSWSDYSGGNFSLYQIYVSPRSDFLDASITTISSQNTSYTFLTNLLPGRTYYVSVVLRLTNDQVYQSQVVKITYNNPVDLGLNLVIVGGIGIYAYLAYRVFRKKKS